MLGCSVSRSRCRCRSKRDRRRSRQAWPCASQLHGAAPTGGCRRCSCADGRRPEAISPKRGSWRTGSHALWRRREQLKARRSRTTRRKPRESARTNDRRRGSRATAPRKVGSRGGRRSPGRRGWRAGCRHRRADCGGKSAEQLKRRTAGRRHPRRQPRRRRHARKPSPTRRTARRGPRRGSARGRRGAVRLRQQQPSSPGVGRGRGSRPGTKEQQRKSQVAAAHEREPKQSGPAAEAH